MVSHLFRPGHAIFRLWLIATITILAGGPAASGPAGAQVARTDTFFPALGPAVASSDEAGEITVTGTGFTPGGMVFVALHDLWGNTRHETHWVTASAISYQPPQDLPPGAGFSFDTGGNVFASFMIAQAATAVPDGSQNPALGPVTSQPTAMPGLGCATSLMVVAYDRSTATWSNAVEVDQGCAG